ncbi:MAG TPA: hypothetical protein VFU72_08845 [Nitrolancea sp.]|nr:hypothetical protein [Nitrolancea sp.]
MATAKSATGTRSGTQWQAALERYRQAEQARRAALARAAKLRARAKAMEEDIEDLRYCVAQAAEARGIDDDHVLDGYELIADLEERQAKLRREAYALEQRYAAPEAVAAAAAERGA